jgi:hypothetical protein
MSQFDVKTPSTQIPSASPPLTLRQQWLAVLQTTIPVQELARLIMIYYGPIVISPAIAILHGRGVVPPDRHIQDVDTTIKISNTKTLANGNVLLSEHNIPRTVKLPRSKFPSPVELRLLLETFEDTKETILEIRFLTRANDILRVRRLDILSDSASVFPNLDHKSLVRSAVLDIHTTYALEFELDLSTLVSCRQCSRWMADVEHSTHSEKCSQIVVCPACGVSMKRHVYHDTHLIAAFINDGTFDGTFGKRCPLYPYHCRYCKKDWPVSEQKAHTFVCPEMPVSDTCWCVTMPMTRTRGGWAQHRLVCDRRPSNCMDCKQTMEFRALEGHTTLECLDKMITKRCDCCLDDRQAPITLTRGEWQKHICWRVCLARLEARVQKLEMQFVSQAP